MCAFPLLIITSLPVVVCVRSHTRVQTGGRSDAGAARPCE